MTPTDYTGRKTEFARCLTVYGRKPVLEALQQPAVTCARLHLARSNRPAAILEEIERLARATGAEIKLHDRLRLSRISRNSREDQGVAADIRWPGYRLLEDACGEAAPAGATLLAADGITNPQNLGMLIRSAAAGRCDGIILPRRGGCDISPLVIKASAGALFRAPLLRCEGLPDALSWLRARGWKVAILDAAADKSLFDLLDETPRVFVLGGETAGVSTAVHAIADESLAIPMQNGVESLNVAVSAALVAFRGALRPSLRPGPGVSG